MKSRNLNLKYACGQCKSAKERKRARLNREKDELDAEDANEDKDNNNGGMRIDEEACSDNTDDKEDIAVTETTGKKRKRSGENHSH